MKMLKTEIVASVLTAGALAMVGCHDGHHHERHSDRYYYERDWDHGRHWHGRHDYYGRRDYDRDHWHGGYRDVSYRGR
jgi:hypothetical protein